MAERDARRFMRGVADDFSGNGGLDRAGLQRLVRAQMLANAHIGSIGGPMQIRIDGDRARVRFQVLLAGGSWRLLPEAAQAYAIDSDWREEQGEWRVHYAHWQPRM